jgi:hypothetical protein
MDISNKTEKYIPEGWKLFPIEPTEEMIDAAYWNIKPDVIWGDRIAVYKAMVEAAPKHDKNIEMIQNQQKPVVWMQSNHLDKFIHNACGADSMFAKCSVRQLQPDYKPLYIFEKIII